MAHGILVVKFWLHVSKEEQLRRFRAIDSNQLQEVEDRRRGLAKPCPVDGLHGCCQRHGGAHQHAHRAVDAHRGERQELCPGEGAHHAGRPDGRSIEEVILCYGSSAWAEAHALPSRNTARRLELARAGERSRRLNRSGRSERISRWSVQVVRAKRGDLVHVRIHHADRRRAFASARREPNRAVPGDLIFGVSASNCGFG